jgi:hypothetical protein
MTKHDFALVAAAIAATPMTARSRTALIARLSADFAERYPRFRADLFAEAARP